MLCDSFKNLLRAVAVQKRIRKCGTHDGNLKIKFQAVFSIFELILEQKRNVLTLGTCWEIRRTDCEGKRAMECCAVQLGGVQALWLWCDNDVRCHCSRVKFYLHLKLWKNASTNKIDIQSMLNCRMSEVPPFRAYVRRRFSVSVWFTPAN